MPRLFGGSSWKVCVFVIILDVQEKVTMNEILNPSPTLVSNFKTNTNHFLTSVSNTLSRNTTTQYRPTCIELMMSSACLHSRDVFLGMQCLSCIMVSSVLPSLATRLHYDFTLLYIEACTYTR